MSTEKITGFVLAGGKSSRMGTDKAMLSFNEKPLLVHAVEQIKPLCQNIFVSGSKPEYSCAGLEMIPDSYESKGPISGIFSALMHSETDWNLMLSVDSPFMNEALFGYLTQNTENYQSVVPVHASGTEPLMALYHKSAGPVIREMIELGDYRILNLLSRIKTNFLDCNPLLAMYPRLFLNVNRMEDYLSI